MTWLPRLSTRTALFADAVDRVHARNWSVPSRPLDDDTAALVRLAEDLQRLREHSLVTPGASFVADLRVQLMEAAPSAIVVIPPAQRRPSHTPLPGVPSRRVRFSIAGATLAVAASCFALVVASQSALPGDPLYAAKRAVEHVEVATAGTQADRGRVLLDQAGTRLDEVHDLATTREDQPANSILMTKTLDTFNEQLGDGTTSILNAYHDGDDTAIADAREFNADALRTLDDLKDEVPDEVKPDVAAASEVVIIMDKVTQQTCLTCSLLPPLVLPDDLQHLVDQLPAGSLPTDLLPVDVLPGGLLPNADDPLSDLLPSAPGLPGLPVLPGLPGKTTHAPGTQDPTHGGQGTQGTQAQRTVAMAPRLQSRPTQATQ